MQFTKFVKALNSQQGCVQVLYTVLAHRLHHLGAVRGALQGAQLAAGLRPGAQLAAGLRPGA